MRQTRIGKARRRIARLYPALIIVISGFGLAACGSTSSFDAFKSKPESTVLLVESVPTGVDAQSSLGPKCRTPCTMPITTAGDFTLSFARDGYQPQTVTVHSTLSGGGFMTSPSPVLDPGSVFVTLEAVPQAKPPARPARPRPQSTGAGAQQ